MTDTASLADTSLRGAQRPVDERGTLDIRAKAVEHMLCNAALTVPGSVTHSAGLRQLGVLTGAATGLPSASVTFRGDTATATLDIAATWPCAAEQLAAAVRDTARAEASRLSGTDITRVDVTLHVVPAADARGAGTPTRRASSTRRVQ